MDLTNKTELLNYTKQHNLWAKKGLSQNFLVDKEALNKIVETAEIKPDDFVVEIGPGVGTLTKELISKANEVITIEKDNDLASLLPEMTKSEFQITNEISNAQKLEIGNLDFDLTLEIRNLEFNRHLRVINGDILKVNLDQIIAGRSYKVVANIPYAITSKILKLFLSREQKPEMMVLLVQKEVAERVCAEPGAMSTLSVSVQLYGKPEIIDIVPANSFFPSPKVDSAILKIENIRNPFCHPELVSGSQKIPDQVRNDNIMDESSFFRCVHIGFASRRKTLANNLSAGYQLDKNKAIDIIRAAGLSENVRAQELSINDWKKICLKI